MAENASSNVKVEHSQAEPNNVAATKLVSESAAPQKTDKVPQQTGKVDATASQPGTNGVASPAVNGNNSVNSVESAGKPSRPRPKFDAATEEHVRDLMMRARKVANGEDNSFKSEEDVYDLALLTNDLVRLMNATFIVSTFKTNSWQLLTLRQATDTIVRGVAYMQGGSHPHPKTAMGFARRDRRAQLDRQRAEQGLGDSSNRVPSEAKTDAKDNTQAAKNANCTEAGTDDGSNKENSVPVNGGQQQNLEAAQKKPNKKKGYWKYRRDLGKRKDSANAKAQENKADGQADGAVEAKDNTKENGAVKEDKPDTSSSDTVVEEHGGVDGVVAEPIKV